MSVIENFAALSVQEQRTFAESLLKMINSENIFSSDTLFEIIEVEADELDGSLRIDVSHTDDIEIVREATWQAASEEDASDDPGYDADYSDSIFKDAESAFNTLETIIDGYKVSLSIGDVDENETVDIDVSDISAEDAGIGHYEYWGRHEYDSRPYVEVEGTITKACTCTLAFFVEPVDEPAVAEEPEEN